MAFWTLTKDDGEREVVSDPELAVMEDGSFKDLQPLDGAPVQAVAGRVLNLIEKFRDTLFEGETERLVLENLVERVSWDFMTESAEASRMGPYTEGDKE